MKTATRTRHRVVVDHTALARTIGTRIRAARLAVGLTQQELAGDRYTKAYISALELGHAKPSMAALDYLAPRLGTTPDRILAEPKDRWTRLDADLHLASGRFAQALEAYDDLLETAGDRTIRAELLLGMGESLCRLARVNEAAGLLAEAQGTFGAVGRAADSHRAQYWLAYVHHMLDDFDESRRLLRELLEAGGPDMEDPDFDMRIRIALAQTESGQGHNDRALAYLEEARASAEKLDIRRRATWLDSLARARRATGDAEGAIRAGMEALTLFRTLDATHAAANIQNGLALTHLKLGNLSRARELANEAHDVADRARDVPMSAATTDTLAAIALADGDASTALQLADTVLALHGEDVGAGVRMSALMNRARALGVLGRPDEAVDNWEEAASLAASSPSVSRRRDVYGAWAEALAAEGRHAEAYEVMRRAIS